MLNFARKRHFSVDCAQANKKNTCCSRTHLSHPAGTKPPKPARWQTWRPARSSAWHEQRFKNTEKVSFASTKKNINNQPVCISQTLEFTASTFQALSLVWGIRPGDFGFLSLPVTGSSLGSGALGDVRLDGQVTPDQSSTASLIVPPRAVWLFPLFQFRLVRWNESDHCGNFCFPYCTSNTADP